MKKILIIDDDIDYVNSTKIRLENSGYAVSFSYDVEKGFGMAKNDSPDLIILDGMFVGPSGSDGFDVSKRLAKDPDTQRIPVIMVSGVRKIYDLKNEIQPDSKTLPVRAFLEKPVDPDVLLKEIEKNIA